MSAVIKLKRGLDIKLKGAARNSLGKEIKSVEFGIRPPEFPGIIPKLCVKPGEQVKAGSALFFDKVRPDIKFSSPVSGVVKAVNRGEKRKILEIVVERSGDEYIDFGKSEIDVISREEIKNRMLQAGLWPLIRQRPYHIIADPGGVPKSIFISGFDTAPLAPDLDFIIGNSSMEHFQAGINIISKLTDGKIYLVLNGGTAVQNALKDVKGVEVKYVSGPHPAGNVGVQIHHIDPVNKGDTVWYLNIQDIITTGLFFTEGIYKHDRIIALTGSEVVDPQYYRIRSGASIRELVEGNVKEGNLRFISGNVLTGTRIDKDGFLGLYDSMVTVIPEGDYFEFFGWIMPGFNKYSFSKTYMSSIFRKKSYKLDTNLHGGYRAFVMTGQYEKVLPMDIYPMQLLKAIIAEDIDGMENLGIYEIAEEDFALCEFICPSKTEIQSIVRQGLDLMVKEMN
jgi:Na+-transporting NADH:ubiquinone oxidoreductase subunit A